MSTDPPAWLTIGFAGRVHGNYALSSGLAVGIHAGYLLFARSYDDSSVTLTPRGRPTATSQIEEKQRLGGFLVGLEALYTSVGDWPFTGRLNAGFLIGSLRDARTGTFKDSTGAAYALDTTQSPSATYLYVAPEVRIGRKLSEHFELSAGATLFVLVGVSTPKWSSSATVPAGADGIATAPATALLGGLMLVAVPSIDARYQF